MPIPGCRVISLLFLAMLAIPGCGLVEDMGLQYNPNAQGIFSLLSRPSPSQATAWALDKDNADHRYQGTLLLANAPFAGEEVYIDLFVDNLGDEDAAVRSAAARALAHHGGPQHVPLLINALYDETELVRFEAARALQRIHSDLAVRPLIDKLDEAKEESSEVRAACAHALGQYPEPRVLAALAASIRDQSLAVNISAEEALHFLTGQDFGLDQRAWLAYVDEASDPFEGQLAYVYPHFERDRRWVEYIPLVPPAPNEPSAQPVGMPRQE
ncbi:MAG: HEAT repeat domain-containing protein [Phycisphaerales bacterium]|nr:HEAT repeat domain-containing protein [Phycisphaerales bacterium]MCB9837059.1 HEAT repeat domain-containing protein [Phycisphaera sp.]